MSIWIIDPHEPLIFRDGKPFDATPGVRAQSLPFPFPSTVAGGIRTLAGLDGQGRFTISGDEELGKLKKLGIRGPILVELARNGLDIDANHWLVPAPGDALVREKGSKSQGEIAQLLPLEPDEEVKTDLQSELLLVGQKDYEKKKPNPKAPRYWYWHHFENWLIQPQVYKDKTIALADIGHNGPGEQVRVHAAIDPMTRAGKDQHLFDTVGMEFAALMHQPTSPESEQEKDIEPRLHLQHARALGLAVSVDDRSPYARNLEQRLSPFGGERRLASWRKSEVAWPTCPEKVKEAILKDGRCRLILITPTFFNKGYRPTTCLESPHVQVTLQAIKIDRSQIVSGFDMEKGKPRGTRRLAPAGTVLFLELKGDKGDIERWIDETWMHCLTEGEELADGKPQEYYDGFGLAVLGTWSK